MLSQFAFRICMGTAVSLSFLSCNQNNGNSSEQGTNFLKIRKKDTSKQTKNNTVEPAPQLVKSDNITEDKAYIEQAYEVMKLLRNRNIAGLTKHIHPEYGLSFSPYAFVNGPPKFTSLQLIQIATTDSAMHWGYFDGSGDSIFMAFWDYFDAFVYCAPFHNEADTADNYVGHSSNSLNNFDEVYKNGKYVDFYVNGTEEYGYLDWRTLRLGFVKKSNHWYLVAIIHDEWTT